VICVARIAWSGRSGRIETTSGPENAPAGTHSIEVRYIGTLTPISMFEHRTWLRVAHAEAQEVEGVGSGQRHEVGLREARGEPARGPRPLAAADGRAQLAGIRV
jgi:hypothetical protein